jgi:archaellum component FlaC
MEKTEVSLNDVLKEVRTGFARIDGQFAKVDNQFARIDGQFAKVDDQFARIDGQFAKVDDQFTLVKQEFQSVRSDMSEFRTEVNVRFDKVETSLNFVAAQTTKTIDEVAVLKARVSKIEGPSA